MMHRNGLLVDGGLRLRGLLVLDEGVRHVVFLLFQDERFDDTKFRELSTYVFLLYLRGGGGTVLLMLEM